MLVVVRGARRPRGGALNLDVGREVCGGAAVELDARKGLEGHARDQRVQEEEQPRHKRKHGLLHRRTRETAVAAQICEAEDEEHEHDGEGHHHPENEPVEVAVHSEALKGGGERGHAQVDTDGDRIDEGADRRWVSERVHALDAADHLVKGPCSTTARSKGTVREHAARSNGGCTSGKWQGSGISMASWRTDDLQLIGGVGRAPESGDRV